MTTFAKITCPDINNIKARLTELASMSEKGAVLAVARGMFAWGEDTARRAKYVTPKDTGNLRASIHANVKRSGGKVTLTIGAGGPAGSGNIDNETNKKHVGYAKIVHEQLGKVVWRTPGTGPKYLENPINERIFLLDDEVGDQVDKALEMVMRK